MKDPDAPLDLVELGVNKASVFKGFCPKHDTILIPLVVTREIFLQLSNHQNVFENITTK
jgi:hypothetical protein